MGEEEGEDTTQYFSKDFEWQDLRNEIEKDSSLRHHILPFKPSSSSPSSPCSTSPLSNDSEAWKSFHNRHSTGRFFKERRYLLKEFPELVHCDESSTVLEVGCGNGSTVLPILRENIVVYACDCSPEAVDRANEMIDRSDAVAIKDRFHAFCCDFCLNGFPNWLICNTCQRASRKESSYCRTDQVENTGSEIDGSSSLCCIGGVNFVTMIFTLSAVPFEKMLQAIIECFAVLKPGGLLLFRDYGLYDMTMLRFQPHQRVGFREYMRSDGTRSYFFCLDTVKELFVGAGFIELELEYCCVKSMNRRKGTSMRRVWVHGKFQKPV